MSADKAINFMTLDIIEQILAHAENPEQLCQYLAGQMRELVGARLVLLLEYRSETPETSWRLITSCPRHLAAGLNLDAIYALARACETDSRMRFHTSRETGEAAIQLKRGGWESMALLPLGFGSQRYGIMILLDIIDPIHTSRSIDTLGPLGGIIGIIMRNSMLYSELENTIERRATELAASELRFRTLTETAPVGVYQTAPDGTLGYVNNMWAELCGMPIGEATGADWLTNVHPDDRPRVNELWQRCQRQNQPMTIELRYLRPDRSVVWVLQQASPVYASSGAAAGYIGTVTNITERIRHEQALQTLNVDLEQRVQERTLELRRSNQELQAALEQTQRLQEAIIVKEKLASLTPMVAGVSHELNTPIGNIAVLASALQERMNEYLHHHAAEIAGMNLRGFINYIQKTNEMVMKSANSAGTLVQSFKKVVVDREGAQRRAFRLSELVDDCYNLIRPSYKRTPWVLLNEVPADIEMISYPGALGQVLDNLIRNALIHAFTGREQGNVVIRANVAAALVRIEVSDNGRGIAFIHRHKIFDPFFTTQLGSGGSGLGLSIAYNLIQQVLGGSISVTSQSIIDGALPAESGTTFILELPKERGD